MNVLTNEFQKTYEGLSRYSVCKSGYNSLFDKYVTYLGSHLNTTTSYTLYKVRQGDTYDSISLEFYDNPTYYWVILDFNRILDSFLNPIPGSYLKIPELSKIEFL